MHLSRRLSLVKENNLINVHELTSKQILPRRTSKAVETPILWERKSSGYRIIDLRLDKLMQTFRFVLTNFLPTEPLCKAIHLSDDILSIRTVLDVIADKMQEMLSFCALQEGTEEMVGLLIASYFDKDLEYQISPNQGGMIYTIANFKRYAVEKANFYEAMKTERLVSIDVLCVKSEHQRKGIGTALVRSCVSQTATFRAACIGQFTSGAAYTIAMRLGFEIYSEIPYKDLNLIDPEFKVFESCQVKDYSMVCVASPVPPQEIEPLELVLPPVLKEKPGKKRKKANNKKKAKKR